MPDRIVRDELLRSHRYVSLPTDTDRLLFIHLLLSADSLGNAEATGTALSLMMARPIDDILAAKLLAHLADCDLVRLYEVNEKRYVHIPRFRQRLRYLRGKHPRPPDKMECREIKELIEKVGPRSDYSRTTVRLQSAEVKRSEVKRSEEKKSIVGLKPNFAVESREILAFLNEKTGRRYQQVSANLDHIKARLQAGATVEECRQVIAKKCREWSGNPDMSVYLRPATLFNRTKFAQYQGEVGLIRREDDAMS